MKFGETIRRWFEKNRRELPWRQTSDPYNIWISEVMLQQTRVGQGIGYYKRFIDAFPDVHSLALAGENEVLKIWQGLGYYSRARNLHRAARDIVELKEGQFPRTYNNLLELKGVGPYTAAAIASICFGEAKAVVDGNVSRVIARLYGVDEPINRPAGGKQIALLAQELMEEGTDEHPCTVHEPSGTFDPGNHNQAMMEFGALQCVPVSPHCEECPLAHHCNAMLTDRVEHLPVKIPGKRPVDRWFYFYIITSNGETILEKRGDTDIWQSLYQFPMVECKAPLTEQEMMEEMKGIFKDRHVCFQSFSGPIRHQLTHRTIHARFIHVEVSPLNSGLPLEWIIVPIDQIDKYPVPRLIHRYLESVKI
ncbi:MAG: A/G-specific adenine glycosylase [Bacteroidales bacterium]|nr:A/G-specific adenine glycosylase [Bacteroidales bacterium]